MPYCWAVARAWSMRLMIRFAAALRLLPALKPRRAGREAKLRRVMMAITAISSSRVKERVFIRGGGHREGKKDLQAERVEV